VTLSSANQFWLKVWSGAASRERDHAMPELTLDQLLLLCIAGLLIGVLFMLERLHTEIHALRLDRLP